MLDVRAEHFFRRLLSIFMFLVVLTFFVHHLCFLIFASEGGKTIELDFYQALKHSLTKREREGVGKRHVCERLGVCKCVWVSVYG